MPNLIPNPESRVSPSILAHRNIRTMEYQFKTNVRDFPDQMIGGRRLRNRMLGGDWVGWLARAASALFAQKGTVELSPIVARSSVVAPMDHDAQISVVRELPLSEA